MFRSTDNPYLHFMFVDNNLHGLVNVARLLTYGVRKKQNRAEPVRPGICLVMIYFSAKGGVTATSAFIVGGCNVSGVDKKRGWHS